MIENLIEVRNLAFCYDEKIIFSGIDFKISSQEKVMIHGANGSGKSTFLSILAGISQPKSGEIIKKDDLKISYLFQNSFDHFIAPSVLEDVAFSLLAEGMSANEASKQSIKILKEFGIDHLADSSIYYLSGGEKRLVAICGTLVRQADLYLLDEPFNELDEAKTKLLMDKISGMNKSFIIITHSKKDALSQNFKSLLFENKKLVG